MLCPPRICARDPCAHRKRVTRVRGSSARSTSACDRSPLERWLWAQGIPASAERVFWLHWHEGMKTGTWCSEVPIRRVAAECCLDVSTVTRAYQLLVRIGCLRRTDPGRDAANPFQQATAVTEVRIPRELLVELDRHPNRAQRHRETVEQAASAERAPKAENEAPRETRASSDPFIGTERSRATPGALAAHPRHVAGRASAVRRSQSDAPGAYGFRRGFEAVGGGAGQGAPAPLDARGAAESDGVRRPSAPADRRPIRRRGSSPSSSSPGSGATCRRRPRAPRRRSSCARSCGRSRRDRSSDSAPRTRSTSRSRRSAKGRGPGRIGCRRTGPVR